MAKGYKEVKLDKNGAKALQDGWNSGMNKKSSAGKGKKKNAK